MGVMHDCNPRAWYSTKTKTYCKRTVCLELKSITKHADKTKYDIVRGVETNQTEPISPTRRPLHARQRILLCPIGTWSFNLLPWKVATDVAALGFPTLGSLALRRVEHIKIITTHRIKRYPNLDATLGKTPFCGWKCFANLSRV